LRKKPKKTAVVANPSAAIIKPRKLKKNPKMVAAASPNVVTIKLTKKFENDESQHSYDA
jgi:hypothetical protein